MQRDRKPRRTRPIYFRVAKLVDPRTGESIGALVPNSWADRRLMQERKYRTNDEIRAHLTKPRNTSFHRLVHQLGALAAQNIESFHGIDSHDAIKRLQRESGVCCDESEVDAPGLGKFLVRVPKSISYDCMDESDFRILWEAICNHLIAKYWPDLTCDEIDAMVELMPQQVGQ